MTDLILGIDVGTTSVKAGVVDPSGRILSRFSQTCSTSRKAARIAEQDPDDWITLVDMAIEYFAADGFAPRIGCVGLCSQVNTHVFVGSDGDPLIPAILWQDGRAQQEALSLDARITPAQKCAWWGAPMPIDASHALSRMSWVARHLPEIWEKTRWVMLPKDYCLYKLTGIPCTDPLSNIGLVDNCLEYIPEVLDLVPGAAERVLPLVGATDMIGRIGKGSALAGVPVVSGTMDAWAGLIGAGGVREKTSVYLSGTSEILGIVSEEVVPTPGVVVFPYSNGVRIHAAPTQSGGDANLWFSELIGMGLDAVSNLVDHTPHSSATPLFLPQLEGERAPLWDTDLQAHFLGLSRSTGMGDLARAVYEGVAFSARHALEPLERSSNVQSDVISCGGGGFRSSSWAQIRADVLGRTLRVLAFKEPGILGAATLAAVGAGVFPDLAEAGKSITKFDRIYEPDGNAHDRYSELFSIYKDAITLNADLAKRKSRIW